MINEGEKEHPSKIQRKKAAWIHHEKELLLKHVIEGMVKGTKRRGRSRKQLLDDLKER